MTRRAGVYPLDPPPSDPRLTEVTIGLDPRVVPTTALRNADDLAAILSTSLHAT